MNFSQRLANRPQSQLSMSMWLSRYGPTVLLINIILLGTGLRLYGLDIQSLWNDELSGWSRSQVDNLDLVMKRIPGDHPPGYQIFLYFWIHTVGDSECLLRLPFAVAGIFTIGAIYLLGKKLYSRKVGIMTASMTAVFWTPLYYSQEARANIMVLLFTILSTYWLLDIGSALKYEKKIPGTAVVGYVITAALLSYLHYFGLFFVLLQAGFMGLLFLFRRDAWPKLILIYSLVLLLYLPWLFRGITALLTVGPGWLPPPTLAKIFDFFEFLFNKSHKLTWLVFCLWGFCLVKGVWLLWRRPSRWKKQFSSADGLLLIWLVTPVIIVFVKSLISAPAFLDRSLIICLPAAYLLLARAITLLPYSRFTTPVVTVLVIGLFSYQLFWRADYYTKPIKEQFREAVAFVNAHEAEYPDSFIMSFTKDPIYLDYYFERQGAIHRVDLNAGLAEDIETAQAALESDTSPTFWYISAHNRPEEAFLTFLQTEYELLHHEPFWGARVRLYRKE